VTTTSAPFGVRPVYHPSGIIRQTELLSGVASGYATSIYTGTPVKYTTDGTLIVTATGADETVGSFAGCEFGNATGYHVLPYWPASSTYDTIYGPARFYLNDDKGTIYEGQADSAVAQTENRAGINLATASTGSAFTGLSEQFLNGTTTGSTPATYQVVGLAPYENNAWGDAFTIVRVAISTYQGLVA
jgi:hypothetical protein